MQQGFGLHSDIAVDFSFDVLKDGEYIGYNKEQRKHTLTVTVNPVAWINIYTKNENRDGENKDILYINVSILCFIN